MRTLLALLVLALPGWGQLIRWNGSTGLVSLTASGMSATIQQPTSGAKAVTFESALVYCSVACNITQSFNGTAASATAVTLTALPNTSGSPVTKFWTASNVGAGTAVPGTLPLAAGAWQVIDLSKISFPATSSNTINYTITVSSITGTALITFQGSER